MTDRCWLCHGWTLVEKRQQEETTWSDATGGPEGERFPVFHLIPAFGAVPVGSELVACPVCQEEDE